MITVRGEPTGAVKNKQQSTAFELGRDFLLLLFLLFTVILVEAY